MTNSSGLTTLTALKLQRDCFTSEDDRLNEYAKSLRVPVQVGEIIKGDKGDPGVSVKGDKGDAGVGIDGVTPTLHTTITAIDAGDDFVMIPGDVKDKILNLIYDDLVNDPPSTVGIECLRFDGTNTKVYLSMVTPDNNFKLAMSYFT